MSTAPAWYLGTAQLVSAYGVTNARTGTSGSDRDERHRAFRLLEAAVSSGAAGFDTARKYGGAEERLGEFAKTQGVALPVVTKILDTPTEGLSDEQFVDATLKGIDAAYRRLAPLHVEAVLFHDPETAVERRDAVRRAVEAAMTEFPDTEIGNSVYEPRQVTDDAWDGTAPVYQVPGNALDRRFLARSWDTDTRIMVRSVFLQGLLLNPAAQLPPGIANHAAVLERYHQIVSQYGLDPVATAIAGVYRSRPEATLVFGAELDSQVREIAEATNGAPDIPTDAVTEIDSVAAEAPVELIDPRRW